MTSRETHVSIPRQNWPGTFPISKIMLQKNQYSCMHQGNLRTEFSSIIDPIILFWTVVIGRHIHPKHLLSSNEAGTKPTPTRHPSIYTTRTIPIEQLTPLIPSINPPPPTSSLLHSPLSSLPANPLLPSNKYTLPSPCPGNHSCMR